MALVLIFVRNSPKLHRTHESLINHDIGLTDIYTHTNILTTHKIVTYMKTFTLSKKTSKDTKLIIFLTKLIIFLTKLIIFLIKLIIFLTKLIIFLTKLRIDVTNAPLKAKTFIFLQYIISNFVSKYYDI